MGKITLVSENPPTTGLDQVTTWLATFAKDTIQQVNGNITFIDNIKCSILDVDFPVANQDVTFRHILGKVPVAYLLIGTDNPTALYTGTIAANNQTITLQSNAIATTKVLVF